MIRALAVLLLPLVLTACSTNLNNFDVIESDAKIGGTQLKRAETADQGSGRANVSGGHSIGRATIGGHYVRRTDLSDMNSSRMSAGLHGTPDKR